MTTFEDRPSLRKPAPSPYDDEAWANEPGTDLEWRPLGEVEVWDDRPPLVTRARQATARAMVRVIDEPVVSRALAATVQAPRAGGRLVKWTPRGIGRAVALTRDWVNDAETLRLLAKHEAAGEGESYARVADSRLKKNLPGRRRLVGVVGGLVLVAPLAWWAPGMFATALAAVVFALVLLVGLPAAKELGEQAVVVGVAGAMGAGAWWFGPDLAALIPRPPGWVWIVLGFVAVVVFGLLGRKDDQKLVDLPATMAPHEPPPITAPMVAQALCDVGIAKMKDPEGITLLMDVAGDGDGWQVDMELPPGVPVTDVIDKREEFAAALRRELGTVWPAVGPRHPGHMALFISKVPMVGARQAPWPVASGGKVSLFDPLPLFTDQRGKWVHQTLAYTGWVIGAVPRMGKTRALINLGLAAGFDVRSKVYAFDLKGTGDLSSVAKFAHVYRVGDDPEDIEFMLIQMRKLREEMRARTRLVRGMTLEQNPDRGKVTDLLANLDPARYGPIVLLVDEVQVWTQEFTEALPGQWFDEDEKGHRRRPKDPGKEVREEFIAIMRDLVKRGPALGIIPFYATQKPDAKSIPSSIADNASARLCLKVNGQISNDQILGTSSYQAGVRATQFAFADKGIAFFRGDGAEPLVVRTVDITPAEADRIGDRVRALRLAAGTLTGQAADEVDGAEIVIDIVADCITAMRERERGRAHHAELVDWLREMRPENYEALDVDELSTRLRKRGVQIDSFRVPGSPTRRGVYLSSLTSPGETD